MTELDQYEYELPRELIAQRPAARRMDARLLMADRRHNSIDHKHIRDLPEILRPGDRLVVNDTRVVPARLVGYRASTGGRWEGLFLEADETGLWRLLCKTRGTLFEGETIALRDSEGNEGIRLILAMKGPNGTWIARPELPDGGKPASPFDLLDRVGRVPLPPYIRHGEMVPADREKYQTVYAEKPGAVAAPTAGLHFTAALLAELQQAGVGLSRLTLHVGLGTFRPIAVDSLVEHRMHSEWGEIGPETVAEMKTTREQGGRIIAVGTTSVRLLETAAADGTLEPFTGHTDLFIRPPYRFQAIDAMLTNFHLPRTTLLVLVRTFGGDDLIRRAYDEAVAEKYRFYSYGDAMLIL